MVHANNHTMLEDPRSAQDQVVVVEIDNVKAAGPVYVLLKRKRLGKNVRDELHVAELGSTLRLGTPKGRRRRGSGGHTGTAALISKSSPRDQEIYVSNYANTRGSMAYLAQETKRSR